MNVALLIQPGLLPRMSLPVREVIVGLELPSRENDMASYQFEGFALQVWEMPGST